MKDTKKVVIMEKWQAEINLKFKRCPWRFKVGFTYEWKAWLIAYDHFDLSPGEFLKLEREKQEMGLAYGAAAWHLLKKGKNVFFTYDDLAEALLKASKAENMKLTNAMSSASFPDWMKACNIVPLDHTI